MTKHFCDKCRKEQDELFTIPILVHIKSENPLSGRCKVIDGDMVPYSARTENTDLCIKCYNEIMLPVWERIKTNH